MDSKVSKSVPFVHKRKLNNQRTSNCTHLPTLILLVILIINKIQILNSSQIHNSQQLNNIAAVSVARNDNNSTAKTKKENAQCLKSRTSISILLIIAGDVHQNPGPKENSPNRYRLIESIVLNLSPKKTRKTSNEKTSQNQVDKNLFKELTAISPKDYVGVDKCRSCYKEVKDNHPAVECDECENWIHIKCSDMKLKTYNENKTLKTFKWTCNICRKDEQENNDRININTLQLNQLPEPMEKIKVNNKEMLIVHLNSRSIINKGDEFQLFIQQVKPDIMCITETWMDNSVPKHAYTPQGYRSIRSDRSDQFKQQYGKNKGGGIAVYYKQDIKVEKIDLLKDEYEEVLWVKVKAKQNFLLGTFYRAEYTNLLKDEDGGSKFEKHLQTAIEVSDKVVITGDFNVDVTKGRDVREADTLRNICKSYGLSQFIKKPTRIDDKKGKATIIDHVWADKTRNIINKSGTIIGLSDHLAVYAIINNQQQKIQEETIRFRSYKNYDNSKFCQDLSDKLIRSNTQRYIEANNLNSAMDEFMVVFQTVAEKHAPIKEVKTRTVNVKVPWFTQELVDKIKLKNELLRDWYTYHLEEDNKAVKKLKNEINHLKAKLKKKYYTEKFREYEGDSKKTWKLLKQATGTTHIHETIEPENITKEKANKYNQFFATIGSEIQKKLKVMCHRTSFTGQSGFTFYPETEEKVEKLIDRIRHDVAVGHDDISAKLIKDGKQTIAPWITKMINLGYSTKTFPDSMKIANIKPIHKKKNTDDISNYRPISILPTLSKIFERAATDQIVTYLESNNLINRNQHAYRKGHSTQTCLVEITNLLYEHMDHGKYTGIASLDLSKAYDSISHSLLLHKLSELGLAEESLKWIDSYLSNRKQRTKFKQIISDEETVMSGIPQGSIIGPVLFICFTNDLQEVFKNECSIISYADDTQLIVEAKNINQLKQKIEKVIGLAQNWYENNSMKNNIGKTEIMVMTKGNKQENLNINVMDEGTQVNIQSVSEMKILGIFIDSRLNWMKHTNIVKRNAINTIRNLHRVRHILPTKEKIKLYNSLVTPLFSYADVVWNGCGVTNARKLQTAQNFALRSIMNRNKQESATNILQELKFLNLQQKRKVHEAVFIQKALVNKQSQNITDNYLKYLPTSNTRFAAAGKLTLPKHKTFKYQNSPLYRSIKTWNNIPTNIPTEKTQIFKNKFQTYLIHQTYNTT